MVIHTVGSLGVSAGGPSRTVPAVCRHAMAADPTLSIEIVTRHDPTYGENLRPDGVPTHAVPAGDGPRAVGRLLRSRIETAAANGFRPLLHDHGQWLPINRASARLAREHGLKRIVSPRGMLTPWALRQRRLAKRLAWLAYARGDLQQADLLHATSQQEADELRSVGMRQPIAVIPNGVDVTPEPAGDVPKTKTMVFLSRLHPKKGVRELVTAWRAVNPPGWSLVLAGPDKAGMLRSLHLTASDTIDYVGEVHGLQKQRLLQSAAVFVLPSYSENFGVVIAEALSAGTPVIATRGTPWSGLEDNGCGWWIPMDGPHLAAAIGTATALDLTTLAAMGLRGRAYSTRCFGWPAIGRAMAAVYRWLDETAAMPPCIRAD